MRFDSANCTVLLDEKKRGTIVCDVEGVADDSRVSFAPEALIKAKGRIMAKRKRKSAKRKVKRTKSSCPKRYKGKKVRRLRNGACAITKRNGQLRFIKRKGAKRRRKSKR